MPCAARRGHDPQDCDIDCEQENKLLSAAACLPAVAAAAFPSSSGAYTGVHAQRNAHRNTRENVCVCYLCCCSQARASKQRKPWLIRAKSGLSSEELHDPVNDVRGLLKARHKMPVGRQKKKKKDLKRRNKIRSCRLWYLFIFSADLTVRVSISVEPRQGGSCCEDEFLS